MKNKYINRIYYTAMLLLFLNITAGVIFVLYMCTIQSIYAKLAIVAASSLPFIILYIIISHTFIAPIKNFVNTGKLNSHVYDQVNMSIYERNYIIQNAENMINNISNYNSSHTIDESMKNHSLFKAINDMQHKLKTLANDEKMRLWLVAGKSKFAQLLQTHSQSHIHEISTLVISQLVKYISANQGGIYIIEDSDPGDVHITLTGCYAYDRVKHLEKRIELKEGLVGQCILEKDKIYLTDIPPNYVHITSGLGHATPNCVLIVPLMTNNVAYGAIEIASFDIIDENKVELISAVAESFAINLHTIKSATKMSSLLQISEDINIALKEKENTLMQNEEELRAAQEALQQKLREITAETNLNHSMLDAINKSNACVHLDLNGNILDVNEMFAQVIGYKKDELIGKNEKIFLPHDEQDSEKHNMLWQSLKMGQFNSGEFRKIDKNGKEIWMQINYNPLFDLNNKPYKILMFANFTTEKKETENEYKNKLNAINEIFGMIELNPDFTIKSANQHLLDNLKLKRKDIKNKNFSELLHPCNNDNFHLSAVHDSLQHNLPYNTGITLTSNDGLPYIYFVHFSQGKGMDGSLSTIYAIFANINEISVLS
ncbi:MAG: PAS domain S-box protein [Cytophagales bacterium]|nr:PAS domain S-box protein [Cytophagales bacterium]